jgi:phage shock protein PspC (stress-responsive transcriptional regulator)
MKKVIDINIGGVNFAMEDDAFILLKSYLAKFEASIPNPQDVREVMEDIELRVVEIFQKDLKSPKQVVTVEMVNKVIGCLGHINDFENMKEDIGNNNAKPFSISGKRLYRDPDDTKISGVCSGIAHYLNLDVTLVRVLFLIALICYSTGFWLYVILWIAVPLAITVSQKLEMRGIPVTAENIRRYSQGFGK